MDSSDDSSIWNNQLDTAGERLEDIQDTVGAVAWHGSDGLAAGVSRSVCTTWYALMCAEGGVPMITIVVVFS